MELLRGLPATFRPAIALVQHLTPGFSGSLAEWLASGSKIPVRMATEGMRLPWTGVVLAPDGFHLVIDRGVVRLSSAPLKQGQRPSVDVLFESMADWHPRACVGVLLSGMGRDGADGLEMLRKRGGLTIAQSEETCAVFGMPGVAIEMGAAEMVLRPSAIADALASMMAVA
jgi:two-component system chemotaxis response regulator CheB